MFSEKCGNAGNTSKCGISRTIAGWLTPMTVHSSFDVGSTTETNTKVDRQTTSTSTPAKTGQCSCSCCCCSGGDSENYGPDTPSWWAQTETENKSRTVNGSTIAPVASQTIAGSRFPERTAQREYFQVSKISVLLYCVWVMILC